jgi:hypothetical protein
MEGPTPGDYFGTTTTAVSMPSNGDALGYL